jgi:hypothetical protein
MTQSIIDQVVVNKPRGRPFVKGQPRPQGSGRKKGTQGRVVTELRQFFRDCLNSEGFRDKVRARFESGAVLDSPHLLATITAHAIGKAVPQQPAEESRPPLLFITQHPLGSYDPLAAKSAALAARVAERKALTEGSKPEAFTPPKGDEPAGEALEVVDPGSIAERLMARPK